MSAGAAVGAQRELELAARLADAEERLERELAERLEAGLCGCGCGERLGGLGGNGRKRYLDERHRKAHHRARLKALAEARGVPVRQSIQTLQAPTPSSQRPADAQRRRKAPQKRRREGVSVYLPSVELAQALKGLIAVAGDAPAAGDERDELDAIVSRALERRRKRDARATRARTRG